MQNSISQFDYEAILEACGMQDANVKIALAGKSESGIKFREDLTIFKNLSAERDEKKEKLTDIKLTQKKHVHKLERIINKRKALDNEQKQIQGETASLQLEMQRQSNEFVKNMNKMDEQLKLLYSQFEGETLERLIRDVDNELLYYGDTENQLQMNYNELRKFRPDLERYERLPILKKIVEDFPDTGNLKEIEKKIAEKKKNIQFLETECKKKMELMQKFN